MKKIYTHLFSFCFSLFIFHAFLLAQTPEIDSLKKVLSSLPKPTGKLSDSTYIKTLYYLVWEYSYINPDTAIILAQQGLQLSEKINWKKGKAICLNALGWSNYVKGNYPQALAYYNTGLKISEELSDKSWQATFLGNIGSVYNDQSDYPKALEYYFKALKIAEELGDKRSMADWLGNIGSVYGYQSDYPKALEYFFKALKITEELGDKRNMAIWLGNIGLVYNNLSDYPKALAYCFKALKITEELGDKRNMAIWLGNIGSVYNDQSDYPKALAYYFKALKIAEDLGDKRNTAFWLGNIGDLYRKTGKFKEAEKYLKQALALSDSLGTLDVTRNNEYFLYQLYDTLGQYKLALIHFKKYIAARDTIDNDEKRKQINYLAAKYEWEKKEALINAEREKERALYEANQRKNQIILIAVTIGMLILALFLVFVYRSLRITRRQKRIIEQQKAEVERQKGIVEQQKAQVEAQKRIIEDRNQKVMDSINYALRIQRAILPDEKKWNRFLPDSFKLYLPKDVLAGDFYWLEENGNYIYVAAADCTGHGVPGAMVSVVCSGALTKAVLEEKLTDTNAILDRVREMVVEKLCGEGEQLRDGMDVCLVRINKRDRKEIQYSGANRPLYIVREGGVVEELRGDRQPIGWMEAPKPFRAENRVLEEGAMLYLTTDGFADQFGGSGNRKLTTKRMLELFVKVRNLPLDEQKEKLYAYYLAWKGDRVQIDDVSVIGVRI
jgi:tetratricopeptide (TPR) repeat protein